MPTSRGNVLTVGDVRITGLTDGSVVFDPRVLFPDTPLEAWEPFYDRFREYFSGQMFRNNVGSFLLQSGDRTVMADTGFGPHGEMLGYPAPAGLLGDLSANGFSVFDIDAVFLTHLHGDHVGWNLNSVGGEWRPRFPNASYHVHSADWAWFSQEENRQGERGRTADRTFIPLEQLGVLELLNGETELAPGVSAIPMPGHTPGHMGLLIASKNERAMLIGDLAGSPMQITETEWRYTPDWDPAMGRDTRKRVLDRAEQDGAVVMGAHLSRPGWGTLIRWEGRRYWQALKQE